MREAHEHGTPVMRPLFFQYPGDETAWTLDETYLFGPDILVAPVYTSGANTREVYLPKGRLLA